MSTFTLKEFYEDPALRRRMYAMAQRDRAAAVRAGFVWLRDRLTPRLRPSDWLGRLG